MIQSPEEFLESEVALLYSKKVKASSDMMLETLAEMVQENKGAILMRHAAERLCQIYDSPRHNFHGIINAYIIRKGSRYGLETMSIEDALPQAFPEVRDISFHNTNDLPRTRLLIYQSQEGLIYYVRRVARVSTQGVATLDFER